MKTLSITRKSYFYCLILLVIIFVMGSYLVIQIRNILWERTSLYTSQLVDNLAYDVDMLLGELDRSIAHLAYDSRVVSLVQGNPNEENLRRVQQQLEASLLTLPGSVQKSDILIISKDAKILASTSEALMGKYRILGVEWINKVMEARGGSVRITGYSVSKGDDLNNTRVMNIARGIFSNGHYLGMLVMDIPVSAFESVSQKVDIGNNGFVSVIDADNLVLFSTNWVDMGNQFKQLSLEGQLQGSLIAKLAGEEMFIAYKRSDFSGITIVGALPMKEVFAPAEHLTRNIVMAMVVFGIVLFLVSSWIVIAISRPILKLADKMKEVETGNLSVRVEIDRTDEIGVLGNGFNKMLDQVQDLIDKEYKANLREREAQLNSLTAIINPHFIYNTLEVIKMKAYLNNDNQVVDMLTALAKLFRIMTHTSSRYTTLREELGHCTTYLQVMDYREDPQLSVSISIPEELLDCYTLKFILQPIVENCIIHGFENRSEGTIDISAKQEDKTILLFIADDGDGVPQGRLNELNTLFDNKSSVSERPLALRNIHDRIQLAFGEPYGLRIENNEKGGATVIVLIPYLCRTPEVRL
jgi:two-component system sensor histidine kinase YesM